MENDGAFPLAHFSKPSTAPRLENSTRGFKVTHPFHPLFGRTFELITHRHNWSQDRDRVYFQNEQWLLRSLRTAWSDVWPPNPVQNLAAGRTYIRVADLLQLSTLITRLKTVPVPPAPTAKSAPVWVAKTHRDRISRLRQLSAMGIPHSGCLQKSSNANNACENENCSNIGSI